MSENLNEFPKELKRFNWGAFLMNWIWGIMHNKYVTLWYFPANIIPVIGPLLISIWFGIKGNEWAWEYKVWKDREEFNRSQQSWVKLWFILAICGTIITVKTWLFLAIIGSID